MRLGQQSENKNLAYYCKRFAELNPSKNKNRESGVAPYKPILLLTVIDLINQGIIEGNCIYVTDDLINTFDKYWNLLAANSSYKGGLHYPFVHLESEGFWKVEFKPSCKQGRKIATQKALKDSVEYAEIETELFNLIKDSISLPRLVDALIESWFYSSRKKIEDILQINQDIEEITKKEVKISQEFGSVEQTPKITLRKSIVRNAFFRKAVIQVYNYKCAFCHLKVIDSIRQNIVDGAHIKPFSQFLDSRINNGLSLCKNHHWAFDQGWFSIDDDYRIIVARGLEEESPNSKAMKDFHGEMIFLPNTKQYYPRPDALQWHRLNVFRCE